MTRTDKIVKAAQEVGVARAALSEAEAKLAAIIGDGEKPARTRKPKNDNAEGTTKTNIRDDIKALLTEDDVKVADILAKFPGTSESTVRSTLVNMCDNGEARRIDRGVYGSPA